MTNEFHPNDEVMLQFADGELLEPRSAEVQAHLASCWNCRVRLSELERTITEFTRSYQESVEAQLPAMAGPRALLKARLAEMAPAARTSVWERLLQFGAAQRLVYAGVLAVLALGVFFAHRAGSISATGMGLISEAAESGVIPDHHLTPGATRKVSVAEVCRQRHEEVVREVPAALQQKIFREYGIANPRASEYEIDFLIAPGLGGTDDVHNLWPEPEKAPVWNARVKDELEEQLHEMVCDGQLDLSTAQSDIAKDWVGAYKKYFHTEKPLPAPALTRAQVRKNSDS